MASSRIYLNPSARTWTFEKRHNKDQPHAETDTDIEARVLSFHKTLPDYAETPLHSLPDALACDFGVGRILLKDESNRFGLPAFKILGASWAVYRAVSSHLGLALDGGPSISIADLGVCARKAGVSVVTATEGNCGRAVARMAARHLGVPIRVHVPKYMDAATREKIRSEDPELVEVVEVDGSYDDTIPVMQRDAEANDNAVLILDVSFEGYDVVPDYFVQGYSTMLTESERQVLEATDTSNSSSRGKAATHAIVPCGAGSIAQAVTEYFKSASRYVRHGQPATVIAVEPTTAASLQESLRAGRSVTVPTEDTICCGMNCGTLSTTAWPVLRAGIDASVTIDDLEAHYAVEELKSDRLGGILAGPCGAATLAALRRVCVDEGARKELRLDGDSVVVLYCTEGPRGYQIPT